MTKMYCSRSGEERKNESAALGAFGADAYRSCDFPCLTCVKRRVPPASGGLEETEVVLLPNKSVEGDVAIFERQIIPARGQPPEVGRLLVQISFTVFPSSGL
jgi:hypothetical protein